MPPLVRSSRLGPRILIHSKLTPQICCLASMLFVATCVGHHLVCSGADTHDQVPSLLLKARSQVVSTVVLDDDARTDALAAEFVMQGLEEIRAQHAREVKHILAFDWQKLMLEEDEIRAQRVIRQVRRL